MIPVCWLQPFKWVGRGHSSTGLLLSPDTIANYSAVPGLTAATALRLRIFALPGSFPRMRGRLLDDSPSRRFDGVHGRPLIGKRRGTARRPLLADAGSP